MSDPVRRDMVERARAHRPSGRLGPDPARAGDRRQQAGRLPRRHAGLCRRGRAGGTRRAAAALPGLRLRGVPGRRPVQQHRVGQGRGRRRLRHLRRGARPGDAAAPIPRSRGRWPAASPARRRSNWAAAPGPCSSSSACRRSAPRPCRRSPLVGGGGLLATALLGFAAFRQRRSRTRSGGSTPRSKPGSRTGPATCARRRPAAAGRRGTRPHGRGPAPVAEDGGGGPAHRRAGARLQQTCSPASPARWS